MQTDVRSPLLHCLVRVIISVEYEPDYLRSYNKLKIINRTQQVDFPLEDEHSYVSIVEMNKRQQKNYSPLCSAFLMWIQSDINQNWCTPKKNVGSCHTDVELILLTWLWFHRRLSCFQWMWTMKRWMTCLNKFNFCCIEISFSVWCGLKTSQRRMFVNIRWRTHCWLVI